jgi:broad specificity phosphatase PhoE
VTQKLDESTVPPPVIPTMTKEHPAVIQAARIAYQEANGGLPSVPGFEGWQRYTDRLLQEIESLLRSIVNGDSVVVPRKAILEAAQDLYGEADTFDSRLARCFAVQLSGWLTPDSAQREWVDV